MFGCVRICQRMPVSLCVQVFVLVYVSEIMCVNLQTCEFVCLCEWDVSVPQTHFSSLCNSLLAQQGLVDQSLFLLQQCSIDCASVNFDRLS